MSQGLCDLSGGVVQSNVHIAWGRLALHRSGIGPFLQLYGRPSVPARSIVGLLMIKHVQRERRERCDALAVKPLLAIFYPGGVLPKGQTFRPRWIRTLQETYRTGRLEGLPASTVKLHKGAEKEKDVQVDSTAQEKNITFQFVIFGEDDLKCLKDFSDYKIASVMLLTIQKQPFLSFLYQKLSNYNLRVGFILFQIELLPPFLRNRGILKNWLQLHRFP